MRYLFNRAILITIGALIVVAAALYALSGLNTERQVSSVIQPVTDFNIPVRAIIGTSVQGRPIESFTYGTGATRIAFVGGMHGGYEWNSVLLAYKFMDYLKATQGAVPTGFSITVIPDANPDGVFQVTGKEGRFTAADVSTSSKVLVSGRFNADNVDLNRNFGCKWQPKATWQSKATSAGTRAFSEPEALAIKNFVTKNNPRAVIFWHSQSNAVYASECTKGVLPETLGIMNAYSNASKYPAVKAFDAYPVTGDAEGWLASINIPAITVELKTHETIEWDRNLAGIKALFSYYDSVAKK